MTNHQLPVPSITAARRMMSSALSYTGPQERERLAIAEALAVLNDVDPPYPPLQQRPAMSSTTDLTGVIELVLEHLRVALDEVSAISDLTRLATASIILRRRGGVAA